MSRKKAKVFESAFKTYKAEGIIGDGGSSRIFRAIDDSGEKWAVKLLDSARATAERRKAARLGEGNGRKEEAIQERVVLLSKE